MTITLDIPDETWQAVEQMAQRWNMTPKERLEKLVEVAHRIQTQRSNRAEQLEELARTEPNEGDVAVTLKVLNLLEQTSTVSVK